MYNLIAANIIELSAEICLDWVKVDNIDGLSSSACHSQ